MTMRSGSVQIIDEVSDKSSALTPLGVSEVAALGDELAGLTSLGYSEKSEDSLVPIVGILQDNSGEVKKKHPRYIDGAEPGDIIIRSLQKIYKGDSAAIVFQPCGFQHMWVEWNGEPGEGVPVAQYPFEDRPAAAFEKEEPQNPERKIWVMPSGNRLVDTRYHFGHIIDGDSVIPAVIPFAGTNHGVSRQWTALMKQFTVPSTNVRAPSWFRTYYIGTVFSQRGAQSWFKYSVKDAGWVADRELRQNGRRMSESVSTMDLSADIDAESVVGESQSTETVSAGVSSEDLPF